MGSLFISHTNDTPIAEQRVAGNRRHAVQLTVYGNSKIIIADHLNPHEIQYGIKAVEKLSAVPGDYSPVYVVSVFLAWGLVLAAMAAFMSLNLVMDAWNIVKTKRASEKDPEFLKKKIPGT